MHNMLIRPTKAELQSFGQPDYVIFNAGKFPANRYTTGMTSKTSVDISFEKGEVVILGTEYAGEMKKGVFTIMNYLMPKRGILSMHCSATADRTSGNSSIMFGLSGTGKTTLSADPKRELIGDDEHCWSDEGIFNIEGAVTRKQFSCRPSPSPKIFQALRLWGRAGKRSHRPDRSPRRFRRRPHYAEHARAYPIEFVAKRAYRAWPDIRATSSS